MIRIFYRLLLIPSVLSLLLSCGGKLKLPDAKEYGTDKEKEEERKKAEEEMDKEGIIFFEDFSKCTIDGGPFIQSDNFKADCENPLSHVDFQSTKWKTVQTSHICDESYLSDRGFGPWVYLFRCKEMVGHMSCGVNDECKRGIMQSPMLSKIEGVSDITVSFDIKPAAGLTDNLCFKVILSGLITSVTIDGKSAELTNAHDGIEHSFLIRKEQLSKDWNNITVNVHNATNGTMLYWASESNVKTLNHGFYLDNIVVKKVSDMTKPSKNLRVLFWNIQNGMWSDQQNKFENFRKFIQKYDPDVCVFAEAQSIYKDRSTSSCAVKDRYFPGGWEEFAKSYGHSYTALGGYRIYADDYYPQVVTSKFPITTLEKITETDEEHQKLADSYTDGGSHASAYHKTCTEDYCPVAHGAAVQQVDINGTKVNFVSLHLWPHAYSYYAKFVSKQTSDPQSVGGNRQREAEIKYICSRSIESAKYKDQTLWLMMGDFNTRSRKDNWRYNLPDGSPFLSSHDYILNHTFYKDIIAETYPGQYFATRTWCSDAAGNYPVRYDFMYASPDMMAKVHNALILNEEWTNMVWAMSNYYDSSDHRPILVDFDLSK